MFFFSTQYRFHKEIIDSFECLIQHIHHENPVQRVMFSLPSFLLTIMLTTLENMIDRVQISISLKKSKLINKNPIMRNSHIFKKCL